MINANKDTLNSYFNGTEQYIVPFYQRQYVWNEENWDVLWEHLEEISSNGISNEEHFIGTIITKQQISKQLGEHKVDLIDGQQRLTTISLLLKAIANRASGKGEYSKLKKKVDELLVFEDARGKEFIRVENSRIDKEYFEAVLTDKDLKLLGNQDHKVLRCYRYFLGKLAAHSDQQLDNLKSVVLNKVPVISMLLSANDDEQEIFDTINSLGVRLTTGELLKNYIFKTADFHSLYEEYWWKVFEESEEQVEFWNKNKTAGRIIRTNIEVLLYSYLIIQTLQEVKLEKLFSEYKIWLSGKSTAQKKKFLEELKGYAEIYFDFPEGTELNEIAFSEHANRFFHVIDKLEITTVLPLVLYIYNNVSEDDDRIKMLRLLESYLVRRNVCRLTTKNYNKLFIQILQELINAGKPSSASLLKILKSFSDVTNKFPTDLEFSTAFSNEQISNANAREILYCIALYQTSDPLNDKNKLSSSSFTTEHMMPVKWETFWSEKGMNDLAKLERNKKIRTLGNLTLVKGKLNTKMQNAAWSGKKSTLKKHSSLPITTDYIDLPKWNEQTIAERAQDLAKTAVEIWNSK